VTAALRPVTAADRAFLLDLYASTREAELDLVDWDDATRRSFVEMQFEAQDRHYRTNYDNTTYDVVIVDGECAGRLYVGRWAEEIRIVDIALVPRFRGRGIGQRLLEALMLEADTAGKPLTIHVERENPALRLYRRLGFTVTRELDVYLFMTRQSQPNTAS
jgi:ribosomal protein S18 acetylase RimI-like enzyme